MNFRLFGPKLPHKAYFRLIFEYRHTFIDTMYSVTRHPKKKLVKVRSCLSSGSSTCGLVFLSRNTSRLDKISINIGLTLYSRHTNVSPLVTFSLVVCRQMIIHPLLGTEK